MPCKHLNLAYSTNTYSCGMCLALHTLPAACHHTPSLPCYIPLRALAWPPPNISEEENERGEKHWAGENGRIQTVTGVLWDQTPVEEEEGRRRRRKA